MSYQKTKKKTMGEAGEKHKEIIVMEQELHEKLRFYVAFNFK